MGQRSAVSQLPEEVRAELERRLLKSSFSGYRELAEWLAGQGFEISKSALHSYGTKFEERAGQLKIAVEQARAIVNESPDDEGAMSEALQRLVQEKLFSVVMEMDIDPKNPPKLTALVRSIADMTRAGVTQKKWQAEVRARIAVAQKNITSAVQKGGTSEELRKIVEAEFMGINR